MTASTAPQPFHLFHVFPTFVPAGPQNRVVALIAGFGDRFRHTIMAMDGRTDAKDRLPQGVAVAIADPPGSRGTVRRILELRRRIADDPPDLLLTYNWGSLDAVLAARTLRGQKHVHHEDGFNVDEAHQPKLRRTWARRLMLPGCRRVIVPSRRLLHIAQHRWKLAPGKTLLIPNGIRVEDFRAFGTGDSGGADPVRAKTRQEFGIPEDALVVGTLGHLRPVKNFARLIEAAARITPSSSGDRPVHVLIVGDGEERDRLEQLGKRRAPPAGRVHFTGHRNDPRPLLAAMDVFALSSDSEQHPVALLEAMASGLPAAATDVGDVKEVLPQEQVRFVVAVDKGDPRDGLARSFEALLSDGALRKELGRINRERARTTYSFEKMLEQYTAAYEQVLSE